MKYRILYLNLFPHIGGAETSLIYVLQELDTNVFEAHVVVPSEGQFSKRLRSQTKAKVHILSLNGYTIQTFFLPGCSPISLYKLYKLCVTIKPSLIHLNHLTFSFYSGVIKRLLNIPVIATSWMYSDSVYKIQDYVSNWGVDRILAITPLIKKRLVLKKILSPQKIETLIPGVDFEHFTPVKNKKAAKKKLNIPSDKPLITIPTRFDPIKDHLTFFRAMQLVWAQYPRISIAIAHDPETNLNSSLSSGKELKKITDFLANIPLKKSVHFVGYFENMAPLYQASDIVVISSLYESLPLSLIEASACGVPVVSTDFDGPTLLIRNKKTGYLCPVSDYQQIAEATIKLLKKPVNAKKMGMDARKYLQKFAALDLYAEALTQQYYKLINRF